MTNREMLPHHEDRLREARFVFVWLENRIRAHFLTCFLARLVYRILEKKLGGSYTCEEILGMLKGVDFADIEYQGYMPDAQS